MQNCYITESGRCRYFNLFLLLVFVFERRYRRSINECWHIASLTDKCQVLINWKKKLHHNSVSPFWKKQSVGSSWLKKKLHINNDIYMLELEPANSRTIFNDFTRINFISKNQWKTTKWFSKIQLSQVAWFCNLRTDF